MTTILSEITLPFELQSAMGLYLFESQTNAELYPNPKLFDLVEGEEYTVNWDGTSYDCVCFRGDAYLGIPALAIGNLGMIGLENTGEPFVFGVWDDGTNTACYTNLEGASHTVSITQGAEEPEPEPEPEPESKGFDIVLKDRSGNDVTYPGINAIKVNMVGGGTKTFISAETVEKTVSADFSEGNMEIATNDGTFLEKVTVEKPDTLTAENIRNGVEVAGVEGDFIGDTEEVTVDLAMADGDQVISPSASGKVISQVTITKPVTLIPKNIKKDVDIGGVIGTHEGGSGGGSVGTGKYIVTVIDYDGTVLKEARLNTGEVFTLPDVPVHDRLVFDEWASSTPIVNNAVTVENNHISIGAIYHTASGAIEVDISLNAVTGKAISMNSSRLTGLTSIDWGDGTVNTTLNHTYSDYGEYTIKFYGVTAVAKGTSSAGGIFVTSYSAQNYSVRRIYYPNSVTSIGSYAHYYCRGMISISLPKSVITLGENALTGSYLIEGLVLPSGITDIGAYMISDFRCMKNIVIPYSFSKLFKHMLYGSSGLRHIAIPDTVTSILDYAFINCYVLHSIKFPSGLTSIGGTAFSACYSAMEFDFTDCQSVPTLGTTAFSGINAQAKILVPASLYSTWKAATNWSAYASYIVAV